MILQVLAVSSNPFTSLLVNSVIDEADYVHFEYELRIGGMQIPTI